jgi:hypothetical protein
MSFADFIDDFKEFLDKSPELPIDDGARYAFLSDLHMGDGGRRDDLEPNRALATTVLARWYLARGYTLILGGDIEDLNKFKLGDIESAWSDLYSIFDSFSSRGGLRKLVGNHDLALLKERSYPYELSHGLRLERKGRSLFCFHGHQASRFFAQYDYLGEFIVRYLAKPLKIRNTSISGDSRQRFRAERRIYRASKRLGIVSICGHTHRPLFESLSKYDSLRWSIEELLREYPGASAERQERIELLVDLYRSECSRLTRTELRWGLSKSLYEEKALLIPCVFNSGCATGRHGMTAIEVEGGRICLAHWAKDGEERAYIAQEALLKSSIEGCGVSRYLLKEADLDYVFARIDLLGGGARR